MTEKSTLNAGERQVWLAYFILIAGIIATVLGYYALSQNLEYKRQQDFESATSEIQSELRTRMEAYIALLRGGAGLFAVNRWVTAEEFRAYVSRLRVEEFYPGVQGIGLAVRVTKEEEPTLAAKLREEGSPGFKMRFDVDPQSVSFPIIYLEPSDERNRAAIGFDMFSQPRRREAMEQARDRGEPIASGTVTLVQEIKGPKQPGFLIYVPVYSAPEIPRTVEERQATIEAFVYSPFRAHDLLRSVLSGQSEISRIEVFDGTNAIPENLLYESGEVSDKAAQKAITLEIAGHPWLLRFSAPGASIPLLSRLLPFLLVAGILLSFVLFYLLRAEAISRRQIIRDMLARRKIEQELRDSAERMRAILETAVEGIITIDEKGVVEMMNQAAEQIFGYASEEVVGKNVTLLMPASVGQEHDKYLGNYKNSGDAKIIGSGREVTGKRKDGTTFPLHLAISEVRLADKRLFTGFVEDITERKKAEQEIRQLNEELEERVRQRTTELRDSYEQMELFTYSVAHDLRAPLRAMQGFAQALLEDYSPNLDKPGQDFVNRIMRAAKRMDTLIQDLLTYSQLTRTDLKFDKVELQSAIDAAINLLNEEIKNKNATVEVRSPLPPIFGHRATLETIVTNLIANGVKFVSPGVHPEIKIWAEPSGSNGTPRVRLWIQDNGIGISPEYHDRIFRIFERLHGMESYAGTGIGLALVKRGIERMGGNVGVESTPGKGSRFWIELPRPHG